MIPSVPSEPINKLVRLYPAEDFFDRVPVLIISPLAKTTVKPETTLLWYNYPGEDFEVIYDVSSQIPTSLNTHNYGVWARFAFALNVDTEYICVFDDDTIPGSKWFENCLNTMKTHEGLLGTSGHLYSIPAPPVPTTFFEHYLRFGWTHNNEKKIFG